MMIIKVDTYTRVVLTVIAVLLTLVTVGMWSGVPGSTLPAANAAERGLPDMSVQFNEMIMELKGINITNSQIAELLRGELKVQLADPGALDARGQKNPPETSLDSQK